eukprot:241038-Amphidinium_carterae.2
MSSTELLKPIWSAPVFVHRGPQKLHGQLLQGLSLLLAQWSMLANDDNGISEFQQSRAYSECACT